MKVPKEAVLVGEYVIEEKEPRPEPKQKETTDHDAEEVRVFLVMQGLRKYDDHEPLTPPEIRVFNSRYPAYLERKRREQEEKAKWERLWAEARENNRRAREHAERMRDMREWGRENGYFVGTRGRIPRKVQEAYKEAKGL